jgi:sulfatase maturation enzyme AslB (radical SAM superfamily)
MHPEFERIIDAFYQAPSSPNILILTNGSMRSEAWWEKFGARHQDRLRVQFSIDGLADTHKLYRVGADYEKTIKNARAFLRGGGDATTRCLIFDHNQHQLAEIKQSSLDYIYSRVMHHDFTECRVGLCLNARKKHIT